MAAAIICMHAAVARAQSGDPVQTNTATASPPPAEDPYSRRPQCASMFLSADWQLSLKQRSCDWIQNRMLSTTAVVAAAWSAGFSMVRDAPSEKGDGFGVRFGHKFAQNAFKSTGAFVGGLVFREDPRDQPPFLVLKTGPHPHGFVRRTALAIGRNVVSYHCVSNCTRPEDVRKVPAISKITGSIASGVASELWEPDHHVSGSRALRGAASAYASTFVNALMLEFKPELSAMGAKTMRVLFGGR